jgi:hypothetical protein
MAGSSRGGIDGAGHEKRAFLQVSQKNQLISDEAVQIRDEAVLMRVLVPYGVTVLVAVGGGASSAFLPLTAGVMTAGGTGAGGRWEGRSGERQIGP